MTATEVLQAALVVKAVEVSSILDAVGADDREQARDVFERELNSRLYPDGVPEQVTEQVTLFSRSAQQ